MRRFVAEITLEQHKLNARDDFKFIDVASEGIPTAIIADIGHSFHNNATTIKGWFEGITKKKQHINEVLDATIDWLKEEDKANPRLSLDMGTFKTWLKTSETLYYRYYYLLNDKIYNKIVEDLKKGDISELEDFFKHLVNELSVANTLVSSDMEDRRSATRMLDSIRTIKDLIVIVNKYKARVNYIFDLMEKLDRSIKGFPFQLMLRGAADLRQTVKKIVNLAT